ncbi:hypothetical protein COOONC_15411 [Cooperia oncophora]
MERATPCSLGRAHHTVRQRIDIFIFIAATMLEYRISISERSGTITKKKSYETEEERAERLRVQREKARLRRAKESEEEHERRLEQMWLYRQERSSLETPEELHNSNGSSLFVSVKLRKHFLEMESLTISIRMVNLVTNEPFCPLQLLRTDKSGLTDALMKPLPKYYSSMPPMKPLPNNLLPKHQSRVTAEFLEPQITTTSYM